MRQILYITAVILIFIGSWLAINTVMLVISHGYMATLTGLVSLGMLIVGFSCAKRAWKISPK